LSGGKDSKMDWVDKRRKEWKVKDWLDKNHHDGYVLYTQAYRPVFVYKSQKY